MSNAKMAFPGKRPGQVDSANTLWLVRPVWEADG